MGKDGSGEPASKKFKQSQLCFKSPKANSNLKSKVSSPLSNENVCKSQKIHSSDASKTTNDSLEVDSSKGSQEKTVTPVDSVPSPSDNKENVSDSTNVPETSSKETSDDDKKENKDDCVPMDVDSPPDIASVTQESESTKTDKEPNTNNPSVKTESGKSNGKQSNVDKPAETEMDTSSLDSLSRNEDSKEGENPSEANTPSKADKSALTDASVTSANESLSPSEITISSESENEGGATSSSSTPVTPKTPRLMTPKMAKRHEESVKKKQLEQQLKAERRAKREQLKNERIQMKKEEEEKKRQMKEERKKKRIAELELKNEEKRQKHEEKRQRDEDKKQRKEREEEERRLQKEQKAEEKRKEEEKKEQEEKKKERAQAAFVSFFKKQPGSSSGNTASSSSNDTSTVSSESPAFMPFPVKSDMRLAASVRRQLSESERQGLDSVLRGEGGTDTYLQVLKQCSYTPRTSSQTWLAPVSEELHDCIVIEAQVEDQGEENGDQAGKSTESGNHTKTTRRGKLLQFCENRRPAYFGTWTKQSKLVSGRNPFAKDSEGVLDYEVDSDSEWEEEEEGEDLESVKDDDNEGQEEELEEGENGYLLDNTFVPHGYLSDEEQPDEDDIHESVEKQKDRLVALKEEFDEEMKQGGAQALKPKLLGCLWVSNSTTQVSKGSLYEVLLSHRAIWDESNCPVGIDMEPEVTPVNEKSPTQTPPSKKLPEIVLQEIARMVDGSRWPLSRLVREVGEVLTVARPQNPISRLALTRAIKQMAAKTLDSKDKSVWTIKPEYRSEYNLQDLEEATPEVATPVSRIKKDTLLDNFLRGGHQQKSDQVLGAPPAKKRISLTPVLAKPPDEKMEVTPEQKKAPEVKPIIKKRVALVALPPRTPASAPQNRSLPRTPGPWPSSADKQSTLKPHVDTPRPPLNKFLNKASPSQPQDPIVISDESNP